MDQQQALAERLKQANNILVTVSNNPSVDQLASCIGLTLALNKLNKHATAVFSGNVPSTIEFLQPEKTIEKNTDSLRDFIIALDKSKADKLRYKVEDKVVKIFITPYKTSISEKDFEFSQGDFNVDVVLALGVHNQADLDQAITSHGRILHDATVTTVNVKPGGELGTINWLEPKASSLSELVVELIDVISKEAMDGQIATALLTGIVAETARFSNDRTSPTTMTISAELMAAGANQQLVSTKLEPPKPQPAPPPPLPPKPEQPPSSPSVQTAPTEQAQKPADGTIEISHITPEEGAKKLEQMAAESEESTPPGMPQIRIDEQGAFYNAHTPPPAELPKPQPGPEEPGAAPESIDPTHRMEAQRMILQPPTNDGQLTANVVPEEDLEKPAGAPEPPPGSNAGLLQRSSDPFMATPGSSPNARPLDSFFPQPSNGGMPPTPPPQPPVFPPAEPPVDNSGGPGIDAARSAAMQAITAQPGMPQPIQALNAAPLGGPLHAVANPSDPGNSNPPGTPQDQPPHDDNTPPPPAPPPMIPPMSPPATP